MKDDRQLIRKLERAIMQLKSVKNQDEAVAIMNYIGNIANVIDTKDFNQSILRDVKGYRNFLEYVSKYNHGMLEELIKDKEFHQIFLGDILSVVDNNIIKIVSEEYSPTTLLDEAEFYTIFYDFMDHYKIGYLFDYYIDKGYIHSSRAKENSNTLGFTIFNPINKDADIFVNDFRYDIHSLFVLAHEFGHVYDFNNSEYDAKTYNRYFYQSFFTEIISKLFERLFIDYLIKNNILVDEAKDKLFDLEIMNHDYLIASYMLSLLDDKLLLSEEYYDLTNEELFTCVEKNFSAKSLLRSFFKNSSYFDVLEDFTYTYGDIVSLILKEDVLNNGLDSELMSKIMNDRSKMFEPILIDRLGINTDKYRDLYQKEIQLIKK